MKYFGLFCGYWTQECRANFYSDHLVYTFIFLSNMNAKSFVYMVTGIEKQLELSCESGCNL